MKSRDSLRGTIRDVLLFLLSSGAIVTFVHIWETPKKVSDIEHTLVVDEAFAKELDKKQAVTESNVENETKLVNMMQTTQIKMQDTQEKMLYRLSKIKGE